MPARSSRNRRPTCRESIRRTRSPVDDDPDRRAGRARDVARRRARARVPRARVDARTTCPGRKATSRGGQAIRTASALTTRLGAIRSTFPGAFRPPETARQRHAHHRRDAASIEGVALHDHDWSSKLGAGALGCGELGPEDVALSDYQSVRSRIFRVAAETNSSPGASSLPTYSSSLLATRSGSCRATYSLMASLQTRLLGFLRRGAGLVQSQLIASAGRDLEFLCHWMVLSGIHLVPVLLGERIRLFGHPGAEPIELKEPSLLLSRYEAKPKVSSPTRVAWLA